MDKESGPAVLVADNNPVERALICSYLEGLGVFPDSAAHGREAVGAARERAYDLIFMDCRMPVMDGLAAVREIRAAEGGAKARIVGMADRAGEAWTGPGLPHGMDALLLKPLDAADVRKQLEEALRKRRAGGLS